MDQRTETHGRAALYLRVSTDEQAAFGYGLAYQEEKLRAFVASQDYHVEDRHLYRDEGFSGTLPVAERPAFQALFDAAARKEFEVVLVYRLDRFGRKILLILDGVQKLADVGVALRSVTEPFDTSNAFGRYLLASLGALAELERETIRERTQGGRRMAAKAGKWVWGPPPYGYTLDPQTKHLTLVSEEAQWVHQFFTWVVQEQLPLTAVQKRANALRVPCYTKRTRKRTELHGYWHKKSLARMLSNPIYTGTAYFFRFKRSASGLTRWIDPTQQHDPAQWITFATPPIVTPTLFEHCQQQLAQNRALARRNLKQTYLFNKLVSCGHCGLKLFAASKPPKNDRQTLHRFYHGPRNPPWRRVIVADTRCRDCGDISESRLLPIWDTLKALLEQPAYMLQQLREQTQDRASTQERLDMIATAEKRVDAIRRKQQRLTQVYVESDAMDYAAYHQQLLDARRDAQQLRREIAVLKRSPRHETAWQIRSPY